MAVKSSYKIPVNLDSSYLDVEIPIELGGKSNKSIPLKSMMFGVISILILFFMIDKTFIREGDIGQKFIFTLVWLFATFIVCGYDPTHRLNMELIPILLNYMSKHYRHVKTRSFDNANDFFSIVGIKNVDNSGIIYFADGTYGICCLVVGSASLLLFDEDRISIIERVEKFYKRLEIDSELIFITKKEAQHVTKQIIAINDLNNNLICDDPDARILLNEQYRTLRNHIGKSFRSTHQYLIIKSDNMEALNKSCAIIENEFKSSDRVFKQCVKLGKDSILDVLASIYTGREVGDE